MEHIVTESEDGVRADRIVKNLHEGVSYVFLQKTFRTNKVKVNGKKVSGSDRLHTGDVMKIYADLGSAVEESVVLDLESNHSKKLLHQFESMIIFENKDIIALNKPPKLAVQSGTNVSICIDDFLKIYQAHRKCECRLVHRLDKDTSGVLLIAKNPIIARKLTELFRENKVNKTYIAVVDCSAGSIIKKEGIIDNSIKNEHGVELSAVTHYRLMKSSGDYALLELKPSTGRKHQLRIHCAEVLKAPILGDKKYNQNIKHKEMFLHAHKVFLKELNLEITAPIPPYFEEFLYAYLKYYFS
ncbi:ribosomal large subunit pseudouridine synthase C [Alphaproteobacteria bacterium]|nr:ribosomal large subunit pseudouridine synthase C [Alphaproteobacteria bacterium]